LPAPKRGKGVIAGEGFTSDRGKGNHRPPVQGEEGGQKAFKVGKRRRSREESVPREGREEQSPAPIKGSRVQ